MGFYAAELVLEDSKFGGTNNAFTEVQQREAAIALCEKGSSRSSRSIQCIPFRLCEMHTANSRAYFCMSADFLNVKMECYGKCLRCDNHFFKRTFSSRSTQCRWRHRRRVKQNESEVTRASHFRGSAERSNACFAFFKAETAVQCPEQSNIIPGISFLSFSSVKYLFSQSFHCPSQLWSEYVKIWTCEKNFRKQADAFHEDQFIDRNGGWYDSQTDFWYRSAFLNNVSNQIGNRDLD